MRKFLLSAIVGAMAVSTAALMASEPASARGKVCKADHFHTWTGTGPTKRAARASALRGWRAYTGFEYGRAWTNFRRAGNRSVKCSGSRGNWSCTATGRPCRRG